jgi:uncharacterized cupin superfamily protein
MEGSKAFIVNVADADSRAYPGAGEYVRFEADDAHFEEYGINIHVLGPGEPNAKYHSENSQEDFLVLSGQCLVILDGVEHRLRAWDFVHCPPGTAHVFVGAGEGPCAILMVGTRKGDGEEVCYPVNKLAAKYGASVPTETSSPKEAYADWSVEYTDGKLDWPPSGE